ncbi:hypothetical protein H4J50_07325 [Colwellia sp. 6M3]|jgi:hypothetical protein|uniref:hypothetical protein n=1 Tax=Colwellia sp. 6M3 TaxID=2759849 RepID=UPI0015F662F0|nr:hypothetical protein [Colwellia sp. 6M3]MBA6415825.1 hypothetical protein [Colwellia sp. 6M3]|tara:strand:- start:17039 stop:17260 length:222 start_codon:yes stop_codon:yes gene_type:complete
MPRIKKQYTVTLSDETEALLEKLGKRMVEPWERYLNRSITIEAIALLASQLSTRELQIFTYKHGIKGREKISL